ncbi:hypothetical protein ACO1O0_005720 [Amphichorda felina]
MKLTSLLAGALLVCGLNAAPVADVADGVEMSEARDVAGELFARSGQLCRIVGTKTVNCRTGPGTNYKSKVSLASSWTRGYYFTCVKSGQCITINGAKNCGWHYFEEDRCYVSGHYTDSHCTLAKLGRC